MGDPEMVRKIQDVKRVMGFTPDEGGQPRAAIEVAEPTGVEELEARIAHAENEQVEKRGIIDDLEDEMSDLDSELRWLYGELDRLKGIGVQNGART